MNPIEAFYLPDGDRLVSQPYTRGPWSVHHQHGGPPAALLARVMEQAAGEGWLAARFSVELLRPVPLAPLTVHTTELRSSRRVRVFRASLLADEVVVCQAEALFALARDLPTPDSARSARRLPSPDGVPPYVLPFFQSDVGYHTAMEIRIPDGKWGGRACVVWMRARVPLVAGEVMSPLQRVLLSCDASSGVAPPLDVGRYTFINPELVLHRWRPLVGEWVGLDAASEAGPTGLGVARSTVYDAEGACASSAQVLMIAEVKPD